MSEEPEEKSGHTEVIHYEIGDRQYAAMHVRTCKTCRSKYRLEIENAIIAGMPYSMIMDQLVHPYQDHSLLGSPSYQGILTHVRKRHMPLPFSVQRQVIEDRAMEVGRSIEQGEQLVLDNVAMLRSITQRGFQRMSSGEIQPNMQDLLSALRLESAITGMGSEGVDADVWRQAFIAYMDAVKSNVPPEVFARITDQMRSSPAMKQLAERRALSG